MPKKIAIMQPYIFPYLGYWQLINAVDEFVVYDDVNFIKGGWINRNNILLNNQKYMFTLPLLKGSSFSLIKDINVTDNIKVKQKLLRMFEMAYKKAPYYNDVYPIIEKTILKDSSISDVVYESIVMITKYLDIKTKILISSNVKKNCELTAQDKVIDIVKNLQGSTYINAIGGQELYSKEEFRRCGIDLKFIKMNDTIYKQFDSEFVPNLSIIDVMMFNSVEQTQELLNKYELI